MKRTRKKFKVHQTGKISKAAAAAKVEKVMEME